MSDSNAVAADWSAVAEAWDAGAGEVHRVTAKGNDTMLQRVSIQPGERVLELATGPGTLGEQLSTLTGPTGSVVLSDIAPAMVEVAGRRNARHPNVSVRVLDLSSLDVADQSFDVVVCRMGLQFTPEPAVALAEIHRILAPAGRIGVMTWSGLQHNPWMSLVGLAAMMNGLTLPGAPDAPGGPFSLGDPGQLEALAKEAGFVDVLVEELPATFRAADIAGHIARVTSLAGPLAAIFKAASPEQLSAVRSTVEELSAPYLTEAGVEYPGGSLVLSGRRRRWGPATAWRSPEVTAGSVVSPARSPTAEV